MSEVGAAAAQRHREHMRSKAARLGGGEDAQSVDSSSFTPGEPINADAKTGMRPLSRQARASGGAVTGAHARAIGGRAPRKAGGGLGESFVNRDAKAANEDRAGVKHDLGLKGGGRAHRAEGGFVPRKERAGAAATRELMKRSASAAVESDHETVRAAGGRVARQSGGPLAPPISNEGRLGSFNYAPNRATLLKDGGRAKAHERYGHGPSCSCPSCRKGKAGGGLGGALLAPDRALLGLAGQALGLGGGDGDDKTPLTPKASGGRARRANGGRATYGRSAEDRAFDEDAAETLGETTSNPGGRYNRDAVQAAINQSNRRGPKIGGREAQRIHAVLKGRASGGEVAEKALAAHHAEHKAMAKGRARGGRAKKGTTVNIVIAPGGANPQAAGPPGMPPNLGIRPPPAMPMPMPGGAPPPGAAPPMPMPIPMPMGGPGGPPGMPPRARGGRAPKLDAGSGSGLGRLEKIKAYGARSHEGAGLRK